ncbi:NifB/NifX family molybdenum-iron cluster-binding protein [Sunxiuqinia dokdonensis]|nr:NifB/NifX family molybdenum-iron cluster-binding protein [Sunxiuqinia dokdonensis]
MIKIAIPSKANQVDSHFGHCEYFSIVELNDQLETTRQYTMNATENCGCKSNLAQDMAAEGVSILLAGGIGQGAINKLKSANIEVLAGFSGAIEEVVERWKNKDYQLDISVCKDYYSCSH